MEGKEIKTTDPYAQQYAEIMKSYRNTVAVPAEWSKKGDSFQKFSLYGNYTPVKTSDRTTLTTKL